MNCLKETQDFLAFSKEKQSPCLVFNKKSRFFVTWLFAITNDTKMRDLKFVNENKGEKQLSFSSFKTKDQVFVSVIVKFS